MFTSFKSATIQTTGYHILRNHVVVVLAKYQLSTAEWVILGNLQVSSLRFVDIAKILRVEPPHITNLIDKIEGKGLVARKDDINDRRAKRVFLTTKAKKLIPEIETAIQQATRKLLKGLSEKELTPYFKVLETIINNDKNSKKGGE